MSSPPPAAPAEHASPLDPRDEELLTNRVAEKALEKIRKTVQWPLLLVGVFAAYTGYNVWNDVNDRILKFQEEADEKLAEIDEKANERLDKELQKVLDGRKEDISELTNQLRKESAGAVVEAERARVSSLDSSARIKKQVDVTVAQLNRQADDTVAALKAKLQEVNEQRNVVMQRLAAIQTSMNEGSLRLVQDEGRLIDQPALRLIGIRAALEEIGEAGPVKIAILATGISEIDTLKGQIVGGRSFVPGEGIEDENGYGTWVASLVAAIAPSAEIIPVKVLSNRGIGPDEGILSGLNYAASAGARIAILAISADAPPSTAYTTALESLREKGVLVIAAAGNSSGSVGRPANSPPAFAVSATDLDDILLSFSSRGPEVDLAGPGKDIVTFGPAGYKSLSGSGLAAAIVGGVAALVLSTRPDLSTNDVESILKQSAKKLNLPTVEIGAGRVNALAAVRLAKDY
jgi:subtilisin family serine protease